MTYLLLRAFYSHFDLCMSYIYVVSLLYMHHYFERCGYAIYLLLGKSGIQLIYVVYSVPVCYIFGYDVPTCGSRVPFVYVGACLFIVHIYDALVTFCTEMMMVWLILIFICIFGGRDWPGVRQWRIYMYLLVISYFGA